MSSWDSDIIDEILRTNPGWQREKARQAANAAAAEQARAAQAEQEAQGRRLRQRLVKILAMLGSAHEDQILNAGKAAHRLISDAGSDWRAVLLGDPETSRKAAAYDYLKAKHNEIEWQYQQWRIERVRLLDEITQSKAAQLARLRRKVKKGE